MTDSTHKRYNSRYDIRNAGKMPKLDQQHSEELYQKIAALPTLEALKYVWEATIPSAFSRKTKRTYMLSRQVFFVYIITHKMSHTSLRWCDLQWSLLEGCNDADSGVYIAAKFNGFLDKCPDILFVKDGIHIGPECVWQQVKNAKTFSETVMAAVQAWSRSLHKCLTKNKYAYSAAASLVHFVEF